MATLVDLSNETESKKRRRNAKVAKKRSTNVLPEYQGLSVLERAKKAANIASDNGRCWWIYNYVYCELTWRNPKCD